ncbi:MAG: hypothetical protein Q9162_000641 [Coniocarpon cinnabarinum]
MATQTEAVSHAPPHGAKRPHDDTLDGAQRLTKRFHLLNIENEQNGKLWIQPHTQPSQQSPSHVPSRDHSARKVKPARKADDSMHLDDTKDTIYIHDLEAELASASSDTEDEERVIFLPDIEKRLSGVPHSVLTGERKDSSEEDQQMVLYSVPHSISVPREEDNVRKAILEARARARRQQIKGDVEPGLLDMHRLSRMNDVEAQPDSAAPPGRETDSNAMDID